jgi:hypothetical protein
MMPSCSARNMFSIFIASTTANASPDYLLALGDGNQKHRTTDRSFAARQFLRGHQTRVARLATGRAGGVMGY